MKPCIMSLAYLIEPGTTVRDMFEFAVANNIDGIDFCQTHTLDVPLSEIKKMCSDYGVKAVCHTVFNDVNAPGMTQEKWLDNARDIIEKAAFLETGRIMLPTAGKVGLDRNECRKQWLDALSKAVDFAESCNIFVSIESFVMDVLWSPFTTSGELLDAVTQVPGLKVTFDSGNHYIVEDVVEAYRKLAPHIVHVHFKDWERLDAPGEKSLLMGDGKYYRMVPLGEGIVDNYNCLKTMVEAGDKHYFDLEYNGVTPPLEGIRKSWKHLEKCCTAAGGSL